VDPAPDRLKMNRAGPFVVEGTGPVSEGAVIGNGPINGRLAYRGEYDTPSITVRGCWL